MTCIIHSTSRIIQHTHCNSEMKLQIGVTSQNCSRKFWSDNVKIKEIWKIEDEQYEPKVLPQNVNYFGLTKFGSKIMLSPIKFCVPKDMSGLQKILGPKKCWPKKKFQSQKFFGSLIILGSNFFSAWMANILWMLSWQYSSRCEFFPIFT